MSQHLKLVVVLVLAVLTLSSPVFAQEALAPWPTHGWSTSTPEAQGMDSAQLAALVSYINDGDVNIHSVLVVRNGYLVLEAYRHPYTATTLHQIYSCTKSVTSALMGVAIDEGYIESIDQPMLDFFPDRAIANLDAAKQSITLEHLLTMSSGLSWPGDTRETGMLEQLTSSDDWLQFVLDRPMAHEPGKQPDYNSGGSNLLAVAIEQATGQPLLDFAHAHLFEPLGIETVRWMTDPQGHTLGGWGLHLTPRDMAKFGYLFLNNGEWDGRQIIPAGWVAASTARHIAGDMLSNGYGYQWWVDDAGYYMALGHGGQYIIVHPEHNLVVVFTSGLADNNFALPESAFQTLILPAIQSDDALPEDADGQAALATAIERLANPEPQPVPALPDTAGAISGKTHKLEANDFGWQSAALNFTEAADTATVTLDDLTLEAGLDGIARRNVISEVDTLLLLGNWTRDERFALRIEPLGAADWLQLTFRLDEDGRLNILVSLSGGYTTIVRSGG